MTRRRETVTQSGLSSSDSLQRTPLPVRNGPRAPPPRHGQVENIKGQPSPASQDQGQPRALLLPQQRQIQEKVERLLNERLRDFQRNKMGDEALRRDMTNMSRGALYGRDRA